jgi:hypothetical protein
MHGAGIVGQTTGQPADMGGELRQRKRSGKIMQAGGLALRRFCRYGVVNAKGHGFFARTGEDQRMSAHPQRSVSYFRKKRCRPAFSRPDGTRMQAESRAAQSGKKAIRFLSFPPAKNNFRPMGFRTRSKRTEQLQETFYFVQPSETAIHPVRVACPGKGGLPVTNPDRRA